VLGRAMLGRAMLSWALSLLLLAGSARAQQVAPPQRTRLILKDGTYQLVLDYQVVGKLVRFRSAERDGATEEIPLALVDVAATDRWLKDHTAGAVQQAARPVLSPELAAEEAERQSRRPEVAPDLRLPDEDSILALDSFQGTPELIPLAQEGSDLNSETAHATEKREFDPRAVAHTVLELKGASADVQLHSRRPVFYVRIGDDDAGTAGAGMVVHTQGAGRATPAGGDGRSGYVLELLDPRRDLRVLNSFRIAELGTGRPQPGVVELREDPLAGGHWVRLTPTQPLEVGEYALVEVLSGQEINLNVWDFGVHPDARESYEAIKPEVRKAPTLERRPGGP
jgi:hypothetical protein